jgi:hypothetical protein
VAGLNCQVEGGMVVLSGVVSTYYLKQVAQEAVMRLKLGQGLQNAIQVRQRA